MGQLEIQRFPFAIRVMPNKMVRVPQFARKSTNGRAPLRRLPDGTPHPSVTPPSLNRWDHEAAIRDYKLDAIQSAQLLFETMLERIPALRRRDARLNVLDFGCGTGLVSERLAKCAGVARILGVDTSEAMVQQYRVKAFTSGDKMRGKIRQLVDPNDPIFEGGKFDIVVVHLVLHHLPDMDGTVGLLAETLADNGQLLLSDYENDGPHAFRFYPEDEHDDVLRHGVTRREMQRMLERTRLSDVRVETSFGLAKKHEHMSQPEVFPFLLGSVIK